MRRVAAVVFTCLCAIALQVHAATVTFSGAVDFPAMGRWSVGGNWVGGVAPVDGDDVVFPAAAPSSSYNDGGVAVHSIRTEAYHHFGFGLLSIGAGGVNSTSLNVDAPIRLTASQTWTFSSVSTLREDIDLGASTWTLRGGTCYLDTLAIAGTGGITVDDAYVSLKGVALSTTGPLTFAPGGSSSVTLDNSSYLQGIDIPTGRYLYLKNGTTIGGPVTVASGGWLVMNGSPAPAVNGLMASPGAFLILGSSDTLAVNGSVSISGANLGYNASLTPPPPIGTATVIIDNDGTDAVTGTFAGFPEGSRWLDGAGVEMSITYTGGTGNDVVITLLRAPVAVTFTAAPDPVAAGASVTMTAKASSNPAYGVPTGTIRFETDFGPTADVVLDAGGTAAWTLPATVSGARMAWAKYLGDTTHAPAEVFIILNVVAVPTTTALTSGTNPSLAGAPVTFTATTTAASGVPTGTGVFYDGATYLGSAPLNGAGVAAFTTSTLAVGSHTITARYGGSNIYAVSTSPPVVQVVDPVPTTTVVTSDNNPSHFGEAVAFTATITASIGVPAGTAIFRDGATELATVPSSGAGVATFTTSGLAVGTHTITAQYGGSTTHSPSTSAAVAQVVDAVPTTTVISSNTNPSPFHVVVTFTATTTAASGVAAGTVVFRDGATELGTAALNGAGVATFMTGDLAVGTHTITAQYGGSTTHSPSTSAAVVQVVGAVPTTTVISSDINPSPFHEVVTFTATTTATSGVPAGTVVFRDGATELATAPLNGAGVATFTTGDLPVGTHTITAQYSGSTAHSPSTSAALVQVVQVNLAIPLFDARVLILLLATLTLVAWRALRR